MYYSRNRINELICSGVHVIVCYECTCFVSVFECAFLHVHIRILGNDGILCEIKGNTAANVQNDVKLYLSLALSFSLSQQNISHS